jgi:DNA-binding CsgD family transcriptional regulator
MTLEGEAVRSLTLEIYDTALDPKLWPSVLDKIANYIGARGAFLFELEGDVSERSVIAPHFTSNYQPELVQGYLARHNMQELLDQDSLGDHSRKSDGIELIGEDVLYESRSEYLNRPNVKEMMGYGLHHRAGALLNKDYSRHGRFALQFSRREGPLSAQDRQKAGLVLPHVAKVLSISRPTLQLERRFNNIIGSLDLLQIGVCVLSKTGTIVFTNAEFNRQVDSYPIFRVTNDQKLELTNSELRRELAAMRSDVACHGRWGARPHKEAIITDHDVNARALCIEVCPLSSIDDLNEGQLEGHIIYSLDSALSVRIDASMVARAFNLTQAEQDVLDHLSEGLTNSEISDRREKSIETVNSQVKSILSKTNSANRTQLLRLVTSISTNYVRNNTDANGENHQYG